jgi:hypothetical protein
MPKNVNDCGSDPVRRPEQLFYYDVISIDFVLDENEFMGEFKEEIDEP